MKKVPAWAESNIYWDGTKLTFVPHGYPCNYDENYYQGLHFKWGSLIGIAPVGTSFSSTTPVYEYSGGQWNKTTKSGWSAIPYATSTGTPGFDQDNLAGYDPATNLTYGDICRFIGEHGGPSGYRMPKASEFFTDSSLDFGAIDWDGGGSIGFSWGDAAAEDAVGWHWYSSGGTVSSSNESDNGKRLIGLTVGDYATNYGRTFPASGFRGNTLPILYNVGTTASYLSSSAGSAEAIICSYYSLKLSIYVLQRAYASSVRCVLDQ
jgi:hypothetical protein